MNIKSEFSKNIFKVFSGNVIAQAISLACYPLLTRLFDSDQFGQLAVFTSAVAIIGTSLCFKYDMAISIPKKDSDGFHLSIISIFFAVISSVILQIIFFVFHSEINQFFLKNSNESSWVLLIPMTGLFIALFRKFNFWLIRNNAFRSISTNKIYQTSFIAGISILLGFMNVRFGLVLGYMVGNFMAFISSLYQSSNFKYLKFKLSYIRAIANSKFYRDFPKYQAIPSLFNTISIWLPNLLIAFHFGDSNAGFFSLGRMIILVPIYIISEAVAKVLFKKITDNINTNSPVAKDIKKIIFYESLACLVTIIPAYFLLEPIVVFVFGSSWKLSADVGLIILIPSLVRFIVGSTSLTLISLNKLRTLSIWQTSYLIVLLCLYFIKQMTFMEFIVLISVIEFMMYLIYLVIIIYSSTKFDQLNQEINER